ncbi:hypothetical protein PENSPDRAFT_755631 [Peniophora sp. CONT]|nr:hypothetical protein PENSPDRAFT_755631 [Peniophora sp. CONT]
MSIANDPLVITEDPPPAYHDGRAIERLPSYREGHLRRYHPYGRYTPSLLQRLLLSPYAYDFDYAPIPVNVVDVSTELPSYDSAEALIVLERLGYVLEFRMSSRQVPPSLLASLRTRLSQLRLLALGLLRTKMEPPLTAR